MLGSKLFFTACDANSDYELYYLDLSNDQSTPVKININPTTQGNAWATSSSPIWLTNFNNKIYFSAFEPTNGRELWSTDGITTALCANINPDFPEISKVNSSHPNDTASYTAAPYHYESKVETRGFYVFNNYMYFMADDGSHGFELWRSNGTTTELVSDMVAGSGSSYPSDFLAANGILFFAAQDPTNGRELWRYPGLLQLKRGAEEEEISDNISIYPNPSSEYITIPNYQGDIEIFNSMGISILKTNLIQGSRIWVNNFENGIYFIRTENDFLKLIVNK
jgi:ELWxxDGT repeat protein